MGSSGLVSKVTAHPTENGGRRWTWGAAAGDLIPCLCPQLRELPRIQEENEEEEEEEGEEEEQNREEEEDGEEEEEEEQEPE